MRVHFTIAAGALAILTTSAVAQTTTQFVEASRFGAHRIVCTQAGQTIHDVRDAKEVYLHHKDGQLVRITFVSTSDAFTPRFLEISPASTTCSVEKT